MTIIIKTPQPDTEERLCVRTDDARDATPADLARAGYVPLAAFVGPLDLLSPPTLEGALEAIHSVREAVATACDRETDELRERLEQSESELSAETIRADEWKAKCIEAEASLSEPVGVAMLRRLKDRAEKAERDRDEARRLHSEAEAQVACRTELRAQVASLRAELARLTAPAEGSCWACREELGVAHERARQQPEKDRATDEELVGLYRKVYETHGGGTISVSHDDCRRAAVGAVAARVRQERCLVAQAVAADCDVHVTEQISGMWCVRVVAQTSSTAAGVSATVPRADAPSTLARLLGEVSRG